MRQAYNVMNLEKALCQNMRDIRNKRRGSPESMGGGYVVLFKGKDVLQFSNIYSEIFNGALAR